MKPELAAMVAEGHRQLSEPPTCYACRQPVVGDRCLSCGVYQSPFEDPLEVDIRPHVSHVWKAAKRQHELDRDARGDDEARSVETFARALYVWLGKCVENLLDAAEHYCGGPGWQDAPSDFSKAVDQVLQEAATATPGQREPEPDEEPLDPAIQYGSCPRCGTVYGPDTSIGACENPYCDRD